MSSVYYRDFKVPMWAVIKEGYNNPAVIAWLKEKEALFQAWPATTFKDTIEKYKGKGWREYIGVGKILPPQLVMMAAVDHVKTTIGITSQLIFTTPIHRVERRVKSEADYARIFNEILRLQPAIVLAQVFQVAERSHVESGARHVLWVTQEPCDKNLLNTMSQKVITIGEGDDCSINLTNVQPESLNSFLEEQFLQLMKQD